MPCGRSSGADAAAPGSSLDAAADFIAVGVHVGADRQAIDHGIFVPEIDATLEIDAASRIFGRQTEGTTVARVLRFDSVLPDTSERGPSPKRGHPTACPQQCRFLTPDGREGSIDGARQRASKKRQGTKSREVGRGLSCERYGDSTLALSARVCATPADSVRASGCPLFGIAE
jgi:hypothetical protein